MRVGAEHGFAGSLARMSGPLAGRTAVRPRRSAAPTWSGAVPMLPAIAFALTIEHRVKAAA